MKHFTIKGLAFLTFLVIITISTFVQASEVLGVTTAKGLFFKDSITTVAFDDPTIPGITCYTTRYKRSLSFVDSTNSSLSCRQTGPVSLIDLKTKNTKVTKSVFSQQKGFIFSKKTLVDRFIDYDRNVVVYLSYTKSMGDKNSSHSLSVVAIK